MLKSYNEIEYIGDSGSYDDVEFIADDSWLHLLNVPMGRLLQYIQFIIQINNRFIINNYHRYS